MNALKQGCLTKKLRRSSTKSCVGAALLFILLLLIKPVSYALDNTGLEILAVSENEIKAAYVYYFAKFVVWPQEVFATSNSPIIVGVLGDEKFGSMLEKVVSEKVVQERPIVVRLLKWPADLGFYHILYIGLSEQKQFKQIAEGLQNRSVLTITETDEDVKAKGIMNLFVKGGKVQFEANIADAEKAHLQISSKLLRMARVLRARTW